MVSTNRVESDVQIRHCDQAWHCDVGGEAGDQNGLQVIFGAVAASPEEGLLGIWVQMETGELLKGNPDTNRDNGSYYWGNFVSGQPHLQQPDNDSQRHAICGVYHDHHVMQQLSLSPRSK